MAAADVLALVRSIEGECRRLSDARPWPAADPAPVERALLSLRRPAS